MKQGSNPLGVIQDVVTRWWSTFAMLKRLLQLKVYLQIMVQENLLAKEVNLTAQQWRIVEQITAVLEPFKQVQLLMEGEKYVTSSLIPGLIMEIRKGLEEIQSNEDNLLCVKDFGEISG